MKEVVTIKELLLVAHVEKATDETMQLCGTSHRQLTTTSTPQQNGVAKRKMHLDEEVYVAQPLGYVNGEKGEIHTLWRRYLAMEMGFCQRLVTDRWWIPSYVDADSATKSNIVDDLGIF